MRRRARLLPLLLALVGCALDRPVPTPVAPLPILSPFGGGHAGIDIRTPIGTPILAAADGTVIRVGEQRSSGKLVVVAHGDDLATVYFHLSEIRVREGQMVQRGEVLGRSGMTGNATTPHLHFGVCRRPAGRCGTRIDAGWDNPGAYWMDGDPCFVPERAYPATATRLTYPVPCPGSA